MQSSVVEDQRSDSRALSLAAGTILAVFFVGAAVHNGLYFHVTEG